MEAMPLLPVATVPAQGVPHNNYHGSQGRSETSSLQFSAIYQQFEFSSQNRQQTGFNVFAPDENAPGGEFNFLSIDHGSQWLLTDQQPISLGLPFHPARVPEVAFRGIRDVAPGEAVKPEVRSVPQPALVLNGLPSGSTDRNPEVSSLQGNSHSSTLSSLELRALTSMPWQSPGESPISEADNVSQRLWTTPDTQNGMQWADKGAIPAESLEITSGREGRIHSEFRPSVEAVASKDLLSTTPTFVDASSEYGKPTSSVLIPGAASRIEAAPETLPAKPLAGPVREVIVPQTMMPQRLGTELIHMLRTGESGLDIRLDPPELGRLSLSVALDGESLSMQVTASSAVIRDLLLGQTEKLRQVLADQNLTLSELSVDIHSGKGDQKGQNQDMGRAASETLLIADWGSESQDYLSGAQRFRSGGGRLLDYFV